MAKTFDDLFENVKQIPWEDWLALDAAFPVSGKSQKSQLHNVPSVQAITKKAIVETHESNVSSADEVSGNRG